MNIYVYSAESGVFDHLHNDYFVFGGLIILGENNKNIWSRKYAAIENIIRESNKTIKEIKATTISNKTKDKIFRSLNKCFKFACIVDEHKVNKNIWNSKKDKQRYLDYVYKISVKRALQELINKKEINPDEIDHINFFVDEHTTATNGRYELKESLEQEFKFGTYNNNYVTYFPPIFPNLNDVTLEFCDSSAPRKRLVRAADIVANKVYHLAITKQDIKLYKLNNITITKQP